MRRAAANGTVTVAGQRLRVGRSYQGETVAIEFTPQQAGDIPFQCQMGMLRGRLVVQN